MVKKLSVPLARINGRLDGEVSVQKSTLIHFLPILSSTTSVTIPSHLVSLRFRDIDLPTPPTTLSFRLERTSRWGRVPSGGTLRSSKHTLRWCYLELRDFYVLFIKRTPKH